MDLDPILVQRCRENTSHPSRVSYQVTDMMNPSQRDTAIQGFLAQHEANTFDLITCFSVTMWIHLHHGDDGLKDFLKFVCQNTKHLLIEPQPYKCYKSAVRRMKRAKCDSFPHFETLRWKQSVDEDIVQFIKEECDMSSMQILGKTAWERKLCCFTRNSR